MKKALLSVLFSLLLIPFAFSQDLITTKSGDEINAKVLEITPSEIKFTTTDKAGVLQLLPKASVFMIKYKNGRKEVFTEQVQEPVQAPALNQPPALNQTPGFAPSYRATPAQASKHDYSHIENLYIQGNNDAKLYYRDYKTAGTMTLVSTILFPPVGLVTAIATSVSPPNRKNLDYPDANLFAQAEYARGYTTKAKRTKSGKVWTNFGIGMGALLIFSIIVNSGGQ